MKRPTPEQIARGGFLVSLAFLAMLYGIVSSWWGWFPAPQIGLAHRTLLDVQRNWKNDIGLEPTRHIVAPSPASAGMADRGYRRGNGAPRQPGYVLVSGLSDDPDTSFHVVRLIDDAGEEIHRWPIHYDRFDQTSRPQNVMLHGMEVFEDGSVVVTFDGGRAIARVDACGEEMWSLNSGFHHSIDRDGTGGLWSWEGESMVRLDAATGERTARLDLRNDVSPAGGGEQRGVLDMRSDIAYGGDNRVRYHQDPFHANDVEALRPAMADAFPQFEAGDLLISLRDVNLVAVVDPGTGILKWWRHGPWFKQHDADFQPDGTITVFDNATGMDRSRILRVDPATNAVTTVFAGSDDQPFYTFRRGKHQMLDNGNVLLTEAEHGRVLEVDPDGRLVWSHDFPWDAESNLIVTEARHVPEDFFEGGPPECGHVTASRL